MKPRHVIASTGLPGGETLELVEHDGRRYLHVHGQQLAGPATTESERELGVLGCAPFRPVRQPRVVVIGLGLGVVLAAVRGALPQARARITVVEPLGELVRWHRAGAGGLDAASLADVRVGVLEVGPAAALRQLDGPQHAILLHLDAGLVYQDGRGDSVAGDGRWLSAVRDALQPGGLLGLAAVRPHPALWRRLAAAGFEVAESLVDVLPQAKRPRQHVVWLARRRDS